MFQRLLGGTTATKSVWRKNELFLLHEDQLLSGACICFQRLTSTQPGMMVCSLIFFSKPSRFVTTVLLVDQVLASQGLLLDAAESKSWGMDQARSYQFCFIFALYIP